MSIDKVSPQQLSPHIDLASQPTASQPTALQNMVMGSIAGMIYAGATNPIQILKIRMQKNLSLWSSQPHWSMSKIIHQNAVTYTRGTVAFMTCMIPTISIQVAVKNMLSETVSSHTGTSHTLNQLTCSYIAGWCSAIASTPIEATQVVQQVKGGSYSQLAKRLYGITPTRIFTGFPATGCRDSIYSFFLQTVRQNINDSVNHYVNHAPTTTLLGGCLTGVLCGLMTQPFDTIKTEQQALALNKIKPPNMLQMGKKIIERKAGIYGLWRGGLPRSTKLAIGFPMMAAVIDYYTDRCRKNHNFFIDSITSPFK